MRFPDRLKMMGLQDDPIGRLTYAVARAYRKHVMDDPSIGWDELATDLADALVYDRTCEEVTELLAKVGEHHE